jgi:exosome complex exonuclease RRP6
MAFDVSKCYSILLNTNKLVNSLEYNISLNLPNQFNVLLSELILDSSPAAVSDLIDNHLELIDLHLDAYYNKKKLNNKTLIERKSVEKPQESFSDYSIILNDLNAAGLPFIPRLAAKPNALQPLLDYSSLRSAYLSNNSLQSPQLAPHIEQYLAELARSHSNRPGAAEFSYPHPYDYEINHINYPIKHLSMSDIIAFKGLNSVSYNYIDNLSSLQGLISELEKVEEFAVDLEHHSYRSYLGFTCLMQISTREKDWIIDTIALRGCLHLLLPVFSNPNIVKVLHGADYDVLWLQRDFGLYIVNLFDTGQAARVLNLASYGLQHLLSHFCNVATDKKYQLADWRLRPLSSDMLLYARCDTHYLLFIKDRLKQLLFEKSLDKIVTINSTAVPIYFATVLEKSEEISLKKFVKEQLDYNTVAVNLVKRSDYLFSNKQFNTLAALLEWRDHTARLHDESVSYVCNNNNLINIAHNAPNSKEELFNAVKPHVPALVEKYCYQIIEMMHKTNESTVVDSPFIQHDNLRAAPALFTLDNSSNINNKTRPNNRSIYNTRSDSSDNSSKQPHSYHTINVKPTEHQTNIQQSWETSNQLFELFPPSQQQQSLIASTFLRPSSTKIQFVSTPTKPSKNANYLDIIKQFELPAIPSAILSSPSLPANPINAPSIPSIATQEPRLAPVTASSSTAATLRGEELDIDSYQPSKRIKASNSSKVAESAVMYDFSQPIPSPACNITKAAGSYFDPHHTAESGQSSQSKRVNKKSFIKPRSFSSKPK